jgi:hypothetical protein
MQDQRTKLAKTYGRGVKTGGKVAVEAYMMAKERAGRG